jgi:ABC-type xylose transport system substrate-binding protein
MKLANVLCSTSWTRDHTQSADGLSVRPAVVHIRSIISIDCTHGCALLYLQQQKLAEKVEISGQEAWQCSTQVCRDVSQ